MLHVITVGAILSVIVTDSCPFHEKSPCVAFFIGKELYVPN